MTLTQKQAASRANFLEKIGLDVNKLVNEAPHYMISKKKAEQ
jgi:hypothetical protein